MQDTLRTSDGRTDDRGVSEVLGAILIFGLVVALVVLLQVAAVPALNQQIEFSHNQRVQGDMQSLGEHVDYTASAGSETATTIEMGVYYPTRIFLLNPPPAAGTLSTTPTSMTLRNARASGEVRDYWSGDTKTFESRRLTYTADYNQYASAPKTVLEGWALYNEHPTADQDTALDTTSLINGKRIRLVALDGSRSQTGVSPVTVSATPVSVPEQTITVTNTTDPIVLTFETQLSSTAWQRILEDETCTDANDDSVCDPGQPITAGHIVDWSVSGGQLRVVLEKGVTYEIRMAKVAIGSRVTHEPPHYMTAINGPKVVDPGGTELTIEVRDRFNTAESGVEVTYRVPDGSASLSQTTVATNEDGRASVRAVPTSDSPVTVVAEADLNADGTIQERERVRFANLPVSDSRAGRDPSEINPNDDDAVILTDAKIRSTGTGAQRQYFVDVTWQNRHASSKDIQAVRVNFYAASALGGRAGTNQLLYVRLGGQTMQIRDPYNYDIVLSPDPIPGGGSATYRFEFLYRDSQGNLANFQPLEGDFFVVTLKFGDGTTARYFVDPRT